MTLQPANAERAVVLTISRPDDRSARRDTKLSLVGVLAIGCMSTTKLVAVLAATACGVVPAMSGCGSGEAHEARQLSGMSILQSAKPLGSHLVTKTDIQASSDATGVKTLMEFWQALQYQDYESATNFFYPGLANFIGVAQLALALRNEAPLWASTQPVIVESSDADGTARVTFVIHNLTGNVIPVTASFRRLGSVWRINYLTLLDEALRSWAQLSTQLSAAPSSSKSVKLGLAAGVQALQLQSLYLEHERRSNSATPVGRAAEAASLRAAAVASTNKVKAH